MAAHPPLVSIITVCLNSERTIERTIRSVEAQEYPTIEYIVVDGGSADGTLGLLARHRERIDQMVSEPDRGISDAFNKGIRRARGDFLQFLNADDALNPGQIGAAIDVFARHPAAGFVYGDIRKVDPGSGAVKLTPGEPRYERFIGTVMKGLNHPTVLARRTLFEKHGLFDEQWKIAMDYDWLLRVHRGGERGVYSPSITASMYGGGISDARAYDAFREVRDISIKHGCQPALAYSYYFARCLKQRLFVALGRR